MHRKNKNNKNSTWYLNKPINFSISAGGQHIKTDIFEIAIFFCRFTILGESFVFYFYFYFLLRTKNFNEKVRKPINKKLDQSQDIVTGNAFISSEKIVQNAITSNRFHIPAHQFRNIFIKKHFTKIKYLTKNLVPYHCTSI